MNAITSVSGRPAPADIAPAVTKTILVIDDILGGDGPINLLAREDFLLLFKNTEVIPKFCSGYNESDHSYSVRAVAHYLSVERSSPNLILLDISFGSEIALGYDILEWLRQNKPEVPVVLMTSHEREPNVERALRRGAIDYIHKPIKSSELFWETLQRYLAEPGDRIVGQHPQLLQALHLAARITSARPNTLIQGGPHTENVALAKYIARRLSQQAPPVVMDARDAAMVVDAKDHPAHDADALIITSLDTADPTEQAALGVLIAPAPADPDRARLVLALSSDFLIRRVKRGEFDRALYDRLAQNVIQIPSVRERSSDVFQLIGAELLKVAPQRYPYLFDMPIALSDRLERAGYDDNLQDVQRVAQVLADHMPSWSIVERELDDVVGTDVLATLAHPRERGAADNTREQMSDVDAFLRRVASHKDAYTITVDETKLTVLPDVFSPRYSHSSDFLIRLMTVRPGDRVIDVGCGTGVLGIAALKRGAGHATFVDLNPSAIDNAQMNLTHLGLAERARVMTSDVFDAVEGHFDLIVSNPPFWNRKASSLLELSCFDENYHFLHNLILGAADHAKTGTRMAIVMSNQSDLALVHRLIAEAGWRLDLIEMEPAKSGRGGANHVRVVWLMSFEGVRG